MGAGCMPQQGRGGQPGRWEREGMMERDACGKNNKERVWEMIRGLRHEERVSPVPPVHATFSQLPSSIRYPISHPNGFPPLKVSPIPG